MLDEHERDDYDGCVCTLLRYVFRNFNVMLVYT